MFGFMWLDAVVFNVAMICINIFYSVPLIKQKIDIELSEVEQQVYDKVFKKAMDKRTCKRILDSGSYFHVANRNFLCQQGNQYEGIYLIAHLRSDHQVSVLVDDKTVAVKKGSFKWLGIIEFEMLRALKAKNKSASLNWPCSARVQNVEHVSRKVSDQTEKNEENMINLDIFKEPVYCYFFKLSNLEELYNGENGIFIKNALHALWLDGITNDVVEMDRVLVKMKRKSYLETAERVKHEKEHYTINNTNRESEERLNKPEPYDEEPLESSISFSVDIKQQGNIDN